MTQNTTPARTGSAPYGVFSARLAAPRRSAARQRLGDDGTGAVVFTPNTRDQEHRMTDSTTPQDDAAMSPASAGSVAERPLGDPEIAVEILRLRVAELEEAIRRLADQDATLSACDGNVTVTLDATLTDAEREAVESAVWDYEQSDDDEGCARMAATLRGLLERLGGER